MPKQFFQVLETPSLQNTSPIFYWANQMAQ